MVSLTEKAAAKVKAQFDKDGRPAGCLRMKVTAGGCSGMNYDFEFAAQPQDSDQVAQFHGATLAIDKKALSFVDGAVIDWHQSLMESGFRVKNPKATSACNCGTSFTTAEDPVSGAELFA